MRVDNYGQVTNAYNMNKTRKAESVAKANKGNDTVEISNAAKTAVTSASDVRADKIARLKAAIEEGTYSVSARDVADKLVEGYFSV